MNNLRKIESKDEQERRRKRNSLLVSIVMIGILVFSTAGYFAFQNNGTSTESSTNGVQNVGGDSWVFSHDGQTIKLSNSPDEVRNISVSITEDANSYAGKTIYVASDSDAGAYEVGPALPSGAQRVQQACYGKCDRNLPEKSCNDTMIVISQANSTDMVYQRDGCVFIEGDLKAVDAFIYNIYGII